MEETRGGRSHVGPHRKVNREWRRGGGASPGKNRYYEPLSVSTHARARAVALSQGAAVGSRELRAAAEYVGGRRHARFDKLLVLSWKENVWLFQTRPMNLAILLLLQDRCGDAREKTARAIPGGQLSSGFAGKGKHPCNATQTSSQATARLLRRPASASDGYEEGRAPRRLRVVTRPLGKCTKRNGAECSLLHNRGDACQESNRARAPFLGALRMNHR